MSESEKSNLDPLSSRRVFVKTSTAVAAVGLLGAWGAKPAETATEEPPVVALTKAARDQMTADQILENRQLSSGALARRGAGSRWRGLLGGARRWAFRGHATGGARGLWKRPFEFPSMLPLLSSPLAYFSSLHSLGAVSPRPERSSGFLQRWDHRLQRPSNLL